MSTDMAPRKIPVKPPMPNRIRNIRAYSMGAASEIDPLYIVVIQLNTLIAEGIPTRKVRNEKIAPANCDWPLVNMWCPQTTKLTIAMATEENAVALYPKNVFCDMVGMISEMIA